MKSKAVLAAVLLLQILAHPAGHALLSPAPTAPQLNTAPDTKGNKGWLEGARPCLACRSGASMVALPVPVAAVVFPAIWQQLPTATDLRPSQAFKLSLSARAPPLA